MFNVYMKEYNNFSTKNLKAETEQNIE
jgi:hypothetical protein